MPDISSETKLRSHLISQHCNQTPSHFKQTRGIHDQYVTQNKSDRLLRGSLCGCRLSSNARPGQARRTPPPLPQPPANIAYDLILQNGHVIDDKNHIDSVMDVAIKDGKIAKVAPHLAASDALKTIDVKGLYVTPGLIDIHFHVFINPGERNSYAGDNSIPPDGFTFRAGVTTVVDAGCSGWRNFEDFKDKIIDRSKTRVLVMLNIVGAGMRGGKYENNQAGHGRRSHR